MATMSVRRGNQVFKLEVGQQPVRARMCGFGDKDRRPLTPPPCVRLTITDTNTGLVIPVDKVDPTFYIVMVDLWDADCSKEVNLVRHSSSSPAMSISAATTTNYPPPAERVMTLVHTVVTPHYPVMAPSMPAPSGAVQMYLTPAPMPLPEGTTAQFSNGVPAQGIHISNISHQQQQFHAGAAAAAAMNGQGSPHGHHQHPIYTPPMSLAHLPVAHTAGMFTRNLIGNVVVNATKLKDDHKMEGLWFVFQDLSVRTEGSFRLKFSFVDIGDENNPGCVNQGNALILATCFSEMFQVYSAKKFPGVIESTPLSKAFASQGIKIPIRKDVKSLPNQAEYDEDD